MQSVSVLNRDGAVDLVNKCCESWKKVVKYLQMAATKELINTIKAKFKIEFEIIKRDELHIIKILPKPWNMERTFAWINTNRRNLKIMNDLIIQV
jgi:hypothetical protein